MTARLLALLGAAALGVSGAANVPLRPQGDDVIKAVQAALKSLESDGVTFRLVDGDVLVRGGRAPFNPDVIVRTLTVNGERRVELNPNVPLNEAVRVALTRQLGLSAFTPEAAKAKYNGADLNNDGTVDTADLALLMNNYNKAGTALSGDLNGDGKVNDADITLFSKVYKLP
ncbi:hypothetical protein [Deinococcus maricopensis]|uniref:Dockerin domain-containing protein n=1 Tax=Deinococcus maricopensis (strain DSM 21211 / LMG 22137 / NRRL B-23946 / LB-34) TaxID=709986 RepID=E8U8F8_DEIML|nr:hypothetical protein [Deinococcus maricopensis]ADV67347.1 hypothetical protein Deima_1698 [Deinococcus maricopensis DSM 21211]